MANSVDKAVDSAGDMFAKLPALPQGGRDLLVTVAPWFALVFGVLGVLAGLAALGVMAAFSPLAVVGGGTSAVGQGLLFGLIGLVGSVLLLVAFPGLRARRASGWMFLFWSEVVSLVSAVLALSPVGVLMAAVGFYLLYQIRSYYK